MVGFQAHPGAQRRAALALRAVDLRSKRHHPPRLRSMLREAAGARFGHSFGGEVEWVGRGALPARDPSSIVFEPSQQQRTFVIDPVASKAAGSSDIKVDIEGGNPATCRSRRITPKRRGRYEEKPILRRLLLHCAASRGCIRWEITPAGSAHGDSARPYGRLQPIQDYRAVARGPCRVSAARGVRAQRSTGFRDVVFRSL